MKKLIAALFVMFFLSACQTNGGFGSSCYADNQYKQTKNQFDMYVRESCNKAEISVQNLTPDEYYCSVSYGNAAARGLLITEEVILLTAPRLTGAEKGSFNCTIYNTFELKNSNQDVYRFKYINGKVWASMRNLQNKAVSCDIYNKIGDEIVASDLIIDSFQWSQWVQVNTKDIYHTCHGASLSDLVKTME